MLDPSVQTRKVARVADAKKGKKIQHFCSGRTAEQGSVYVFVSTKTSAAWGPTAAPKPAVAFTLTAGPAAHTSATSAAAQPSPICSNVKAIRAVASPRLSNATATPPPCSVRRHTWLVGGLIGSLVVVRLVDQLVGVGGLAGGLAG